MTKKWARATVTHPAFCGVPLARLGDSIEEPADLWLARCESELRERRGAERQREAGAGPKRDLVFTDRLLVTLIHLRTRLLHATPYGIARSAVSRAIREIRPLPAMRGFAVPDHSGVRPRTLADVFAHAEAAGIRLRIDGAETRVRRPKVTAGVAEGYRGPADEFPDRISAPPKKPKGDVPLGEWYAWRGMRRRQSSERICVEHANAGLRQWRPLRR
ncbi:hypothetical protein ACPCTN_33285 [Streptomyces cinereoruber]|uniref:hypothetical protein n=1 Tax=Streptomyces cinereoruber TaxID=67260 RepID=UPI003C2F52CE